MRLLEVDTLEEARKKILSVFPKEKRKKEIVSLPEALGKITSRDIYSDEEVPCFTKSAVDGYAVRAADTQGAGESMPVMLHFKGEVAMGEAASLVIESGECAYVPTGGMLPEGADAMVMTEYTEPFLNDISVYHSVSEGRDIIRRGDDVPLGSRILGAGTLLRAQEIGVLASAGVTDVEVYAPLRVAVISTGDELLSPGDAPQPAKTRDSNGSMLCALARQNGMEVVHFELIKDEPEKFLRLLETYKDECDIIIASGGSSKGKHDMTADCFERAASGGILTHGIALKPGKPTILAYDGRTDTLLFGLPGHPAAAMIVFLLLIEWFNHESVLTLKRNRKIRAEMGCNVPGAPGRATCQLVRLEERGDKLLALPVYGKSGVLMSTVQSDGYVMMEKNLEGLRKGQTVDVEPI